MNKTQKQSRRKFKPRHKFRVEKSWLVMPDGVRLASTMYVPVPRHKGEKFPVILEILPYRKDDTFYVGDYPSYSYFAQQGFITVKVDIRGTGGSDGAIPPCEYSDKELDDAEEIIRQLAALPDSNGNVGMWGVSWSGFNSIQVAMRRPPALKAILAMHSSDDLFYDDLHYIDGILHLDPYHLFINHELGLPRTPDYKIDERYFADRFTQKPWLFTYLNKQEDGQFWRSKSLCRDYSAINIPVYLIGGLLDGYRDTVVRMLSKMSVPVKADLGPNEHSCPDDGTGPSYEWHDEAVRWFKHWLAGADNGIDRETKGKKLTVFVRSGHKPDATMSTTPGHWRVESWPIKRTLWKKFFPRSGGALKGTAANPSVDRLELKAGSGTACGYWWGDLTGDQRGEGPYSLTYDSDVLETPLEIIGFPKVRLKTSSDSPWTNWAVRLEDVGPDGSVAHITGKMVNGSHLSGRLTPSPVVAGVRYDIELELHFSTWTFQPGHRVRLSVSNAQHPIAWPSREKSTIELQTGCADTVLELPVIPSRSRKKPAFNTEIATKLDCPDGQTVAVADGKPEYEKYVQRDEANGTTTFVHNTRSAYEIRQRQFAVDGHSEWTARDHDPAWATYVGEMTTSIDSGRRLIKLKTRMSVESDQDSFHLSFTRELLLNGKRVKKRIWNESIARKH